MNNLYRIPFSIKQRLLEFFWSSSPTRTRVYTLHKLHGGGVTNADPLNSVDVTLFKAFIEKHAISSILSILDNLKDKSFSDNSAITFDDCFDSVYTLAWPLLLEKQIPFTIFVCVEFLGKEGYLSETQIREMLSSGLCTLGSHGMQHKIYRKMHKSEVIAQYKDSKKTLEAMFGVNIGLFAYPYGSVYAVSECNQRTIKNSGYIAAFGTLRAGLSAISAKNAFYLPRFHVNDNTIVMF